MSLARQTPTSSPATAEPVIQMTGVNKWFGEFHVLKDINFSVDRGERIVICGPSGSGKSTMIRCINALEEHQRGKIVVDNSKKLTVWRLKQDEQELSATQFVTNPQVGGFDPLAAEGMEELEGLEGASTSPQSPGASPQLPFGLGGGR